jgi:hypothetical protein
MNLQSPDRVLCLLVRHACRDITYDLDPKHCDQYPFMRGGFGVIYRGTLSSGQPVAIKCVEALSHCGLSEQGYKHLKVRVCWGFFLFFLYFFLV